MFGAILKATKSSFKKGMTFCCSIYVKNVIKLLAFTFEQPSYTKKKTIEGYYQGSDLSALLCVMFPCVFDTFPYGFLGRCGT